MLNRTIITGRLTKDPVIRTTEGGNRCAVFTLAVGRSYRDKNGERGTDFIPVIAWNVLSDVCEKHLNKGELCTVEGSIRTGSYMKEGTKVYTTDLKADSVFLFPRAARDPSEEARESSAPEGFEEIGGELPF